MNFKNRILYQLSKKTLEKNKRFHKIHSGKSCYIFGCGASLKYFDLKNFNDKIAICCSSLFLHEDFKELNAKYYYMGHPFIFHKYWKNQYKKKYEKNLVGKLYRENINLNPQIEYFVSLSNYFAIRASNINYVHHFDYLASNPPKIQLDSIFSSMHGALNAMLGLALYMGFKNITLVGCDFTFKPKSQGHFFEFGKFANTNENEIFSEDLLLFVKRQVNIETITIDDSFIGDIINYTSYEELTSSKPNYKENNLIVSKQNLSNLNNFNMEYKIYK